MVLELPNDEPSKMILLSAFVESSSRIDFKYGGLIEICFGNMVDKVTFVFAGSVVYKCTNTALSFCVYVFGT